MAGMTTPQVIAAYFKMCVNVDLEEFRISTSREIDKNRVVLDWSSVPFRQRRYIMQCIEREDRQCVLKQLGDDKVAIEIV